MKTRDLNLGRLFFVLILFAGGINIKCIGQEARFDLENDLLLAQYDCKTDIDDLHSVAALATLISHPKYRDLKFHAIVGTYGYQDGLYVPPNDLMTMAFGNNWSDAHSEREVASETILKLVRRTLEKGGTVWVAEGGQSDFSALWIKQLLVEDPKFDVKNKIHIVQHSEWNEEVTHPVLLDFVKDKVDYIKIPNCNPTGNGTPGFRSDKEIPWKSYLNENLELVPVWELAIHLGNKYNGMEGRYLNESVKSGGLDFSDFGEVCYMLDLVDLTDANDFFKVLQIKD